VAQVPLAAHDDMVIVNGAHAYIISSEWLGQGGPEATYFAVPVGTPVSPRPGSEPLPARELRRIMMFV
jgi:hypothetical protein